MTNVSASHRSPSSTHTQRIQEALAAALPVPIWPLGQTVTFRTSPDPGQFLISSHWSHVISSISPTYFILCPLITSTHYPACLLITHWSPRDPYKGQFLYCLSLSLLLSSSCWPGWHTSSSPTGSLAIFWSWPPSPRVLPRLCLEWLVPLSLTSSSYAA
jgi:hypothetical protein